MQLFAEQWGVDAADKGAFVLKAGGGPVVSHGGQVGPLQGPVQVPQRVRLGTALSLTA